MDRGTASQREEHPSGLVTVGSGWLWPAVVAALLVAFVYVPAHHRSSGGADGLVAAVAILYALGLSLTAPRLIRGIVLRAGGARDSIVLLGRGPDTLTAESVRAGWRLAAVAVSVAFSLVAAAVAARLSVTADPTTYGHAVVDLAAVVNLVLAGAVLVPAPGLMGWALLVGLVDALGVPAERRVRRAARLARLVGIPVLLSIAGLAAVLVDPMFLLIGVVLGLLTWTQGEAVVRADATVRFLAGHRAGDLVRPATSHVDPERPLDDLLAHRAAHHVVTIVDGGGGVQGAIGPRQIAAHPAARVGERCRDVMVPVAALRPVAGASPATDVLACLATHGFALVTGPDGLGYVEASDLAVQVRIWTALRERGSRPRT